MDRHPGWTLHRVTESHPERWAPAFRAMAVRFYSQYNQRRAFADNRRARLRRKRALRLLPKWMLREMARTEGE